MKQYTIHDLVIEVTRKCNLECDHCLRGKAQCIDLNTDYVSKLFDQVDCVSTIVFTGGEPSLVPQIISKVIDIAKEKDVDIGSFFIVTNAVKTSDKFLKALLKCFLYCTDIEENPICLEISNDEHHDYERHNPENTRKLLAFRFARKKNKNDCYNYAKAETIKSEGSAELNYGGSEVPISEISIDENTIEETIYLNCLGNLLPSCDLSYEHQDDTDIIIGNVNDFNFNLGTAIKTYNERYQLEYA